MQWVIDNWIWILLGGAMIGMHMFGHGHGGHGSHDGKAAGNDEHAGHGGHSCCGGHGKQGKSKCCGGSSKKTSEPKPETASETDSKIGNNAVNANPVVRRSSF